VRAFGADREVDDVTLLEDTLAWRLQMFGVSPTLGLLGS
jgi:hypothetical protein